MPAAAKTSKAPGWGSRPKKATAAETFVNGEFAPLNVKLPRALVARVKAHCVQKDVTIQAFVEHLLLQGLR
jgi:hypothetical protein